MDTFVTTELELLVVTALHLEAVCWNPVGGWLVFVGGVEKIWFCCTGGGGRWVFMWVWIDGLMD